MSKVPKSKAKTRLTDSKSLETAATLPDDDEGFISEEYYDSDGSEGEIEGEDGEDDEEDEDGEDDDDDEDEEEDEFEQQSSDDSDVDDSSGSDKEGEEVMQDVESKSRDWGVGNARSRAIEMAKHEGHLNVPNLLHTDDLSSDDEEAEGNTIGRVPLHWYDAFDHIGYDVTGAKVMKRKGKDRVDLAIANDDDPEAKRTVYDMYNDKEVVLSKREIELIRRMQAGAFAHPEHDDTPDYVDYFSSQKEVMPLSARPEPKKKFLPSKWEMIRVRKIVKAMKEGRYKTLKDIENEKRQQDKPPVYMIWNDAEDEILAESKRNKYHLPAPKMPLPGHAESYNPPAEYLHTPEELKQLEELAPEDRPLNFLPKKHDCLRHVAGYKNFVKESFERCLDLYLCPRKVKMRLNIDPETLVPRLPKPRELKPFPNTLCLQYLGHKGAVRSLSVSPDGQYLVTGGADGTVRLWEVDTCLCRYVWDLGGGSQETKADGTSATEGIVQVAWNPNSEHQVLAVALGTRLVLIVTGTADKDGAEVTESLLSAAHEGGGDDEEGDEDASEDEDDEAKPKAKAGAGTKWKRVSPKGTASPLRTVGPAVELHFPEPITNFAWHYKGDYIATLCPTLGARGVAIHQLSKAKTQVPFKKNPGRVQALAFHPSRPFLFVVTQQHVKVFHLLEQRLAKRLMSGCKWLSSIDVHPSGDHVIVGSYDRRVVWFDMDLSSTPYKTLKFHEKAVRSVQFHKRYPLMASASDDGTVHVFHSTVYSDLTRNPMIVPLKILRGHGVKGGLGVLASEFHPRQPWLFTAGMDGVVNMFQDV